MNHLRENSRQSEQAISTYHTFEITSLTNCKDNFDTDKNYFEAQFTLTPKVSSSRFHVENNTFFSGYFCQYFFRSWDLGFKEINGHGLG